MARPYAYIRKSVVQKGDRVLSTEVQAAEVRRMAARYGDDDLVILEDIGRSGRKLERRPGYAELLERIRAGDVSAVYAYSLSRLNRSTRNYADLADLCVEHRVPVRLVHEGEQDFGTPTGRLIATILSAVAQMQAEIDGERARDVIARRLANGERHGEPHYGERPGESVQAVIDAYREAGSLYGAAGLLDRRGVPTRRGGPWRRGTVRKILSVQAPGIVPPGQHERARGAPPFRLARLLRCHCGRILTALLVKGRVRYRCAEARTVSHGRVSVAEAVVIEAVKAEAARFRVPLDVATAGEDARRPALEERLLKLSRQHEMGIIGDDDLLVRAAEVQEALERLRTAVVARDVPQAIDWDGWAPERVNHVLRTYWRHVPLGPDMLPAWPADDSHWRLPAEYLA